jgi:hypothetical protein
MMQTETYKTLRDEFAMTILPRLAEMYHIEQACVLAYQWADQMLKAREEVKWPDQMLKAPEEIK